MTQFVEQLRNQAKWYAQPGHNARDLMDSHLLEKAADEIERLRAKVEQMEQQEPVAVVEDDHYADGLSARISEYLPAGMMLYAHPGAQGEGK